MKILFHRYGSICEPDILDAFNALNFTVIEEDIEISQKSIDGETRISILAEQILTHHPVFVFSINYFPYISEVCKRLDMLYVCLSVDCPVLELFSASIRNRCNRIFLFDYNQYLQVKDENPDCIFYLPLGCNTDRWDNIIHSLQAPRWSYDLSFVGSLYTEKSPYAKLPLSDFDRGFADGLIEAQFMLPALSLIEDALPSSLTESIKASSPEFHVLPDAFCNTDDYVAANYYLGMRIAELERIRTLNALAENFRVDLFTRSDTSALKKVFCHGGVTTHTQMPEIFYRSKINLNITMRPIQTGLPQRIWDVLGCKGFLLTNYQAEIPDYLEVGSDLDCYENLAELKEKAAFYLDHEDIRLAIAEHGYLTVKEKHTCLHRVITMLNAIFPTKTLL
ncbi:MAG: DUF3880 domain-containing protein [Ruminococcus flavefaciens]|nr:DUF3880 domain-containing protein [Ruminococcus flavefaciens]